MNPSIQSPPLGFKPKVTGPEYVNEFTRHVIRTVAHMIQLEKRTGRTVTLALEPEPACFLETTEEAVDYFKNHLYAAEAVRMIVTATGLNKSQAEAALRKHLGMVYDICHQAVEYEDIGASLRKLADNGIPVFKLQEAAALRVPNVTKETVEAMRPFADTVYLTQTIEKIDGKLNRYLNLEDAFAAFEANPKGKREWRTHVHVPVFLDKIGEHFETTRFAIEDALKFHKKNKLSPQLEIETYTWDVLPDSMKIGSIVDYVERELDWVQGSARRTRRLKQSGERDESRFHRPRPNGSSDGRAHLGRRSRARRLQPLAREGAELEKGGAKVAGSIAEACKGREVVISMVADDKALTEVVKEISGALAKGAIHVAMGTHGVHVLREVDAVHGKAGQLFVASPVLGRPEAAAAGQIAIVAGRPGRRHREGRAVECADGPAHVPGRRRSRKARPP